MNEQLATKIFVNFIEITSSATVSAWNFLAANKDSFQALGSILSPIAIFTGSVIIQVWISKQNKVKFEIEQKATDDRTKNQQQFNELIAERDEDRLKQETLDNYLNRITALIDKYYGTKTEPKNLFIITRALTIATIKYLDFERNKQLTNFLYESKMIEKINIFNNDTGLLYEANLGKINLKGAFLKGADLRNVNLESADLREANLESADLSGSNLQSALLEGANLINSNLSNANLKFAKLLKSKLNDANLQEADLSGSDLSNASLHRTILNNSKMKWCDFFQAEIIDSKIINANLRGAKFINAEIRRSDFSKSFFKYANFSLSQLIEVNFQDSYLRLIKFNDKVDIEGDKGSIILREGFSVPLISGDKTVTGKATLYKVDFRGASLYSANFRGAIFKEVDLRGYKPIKDFSNLVLEYPEEEKNTKKRLLNHKIISILIKRLVDWHSKRKPINFKIPSNEPIFPEGFDISQFRDMTKSENTN